jgi:hypothetical protein
VRPVPKVPVESGRPARQLEPLGPSARGVIDPTLAVLIKEAPE